MTLVLDLPAEMEQVLAARAKARGVSLSVYLLDLAARDAALATTHVFAAAPQADSDGFAVGSPEAAIAHSARLRALIAAPASEREAVIAAQAKDYAAFCDTPQGQADWEQMQPWLNTPGPDIDAIEAEDARASAGPASGEAEAA
jgi:hypothetical protein